jgi:hypothetical protein
MSTMIDPKQELAARKGVRTFRQLADETGLPASYLCDAMSGKKPPSGKLLKYLGLERQIVFVRTNGKGRKS